VAPVEDGKPKMGASAGAKPRRWPRRLAIGGAIAVAVFALLGFVVVPPVAKHVAQKQLGELLGRRVDIGRIRVNPFALSVAVEDFQIFEADGATPFLGFGRFYVNAQMSSVFRRAPVIQELRLESLRLHVVRTKATSDAWADVGSAYNFSDIVARLTARPKVPQPPEAPDAPPPRFSLNNIRISDGAVIFDDRPLGEHHEVTGLSVGVPFVSTLPVYLDSFVEPGLSVRVDGTPFTVAGRTKPFKDSLETVLELRVQALDLTRYVPFVPMRLPFSVESALLTLALDIGFVRPRADAPTLTVKGRVALEKLDLREKRKAGPLPLAALDKLEVVIDEANVTGQRFHLSRILVSGLDLHVRRRRDGSINLAQLAPAAEPEERQHEKRGARRAPAGGGPQFALDLFTLAKATVHFNDESVAPPFESEVSDIAVSVSGLSNAPGVTAKLSAALHAVPGGTVTQHGTLRLTPLAASGTVTIDDIEPRRLAPYYRERIAFDIVKGQLRLGASYRYQEEHAHPTVEISDAFLELTDLALRRREARDDFFRVATLAVHGATLDLGTRTVSVAEVSTRDARVRGARDEHGVIDLTTLVPPPGASASPPPAPAGASVPAPAPASRSTADAAAGVPAWTVTLAQFDLERWGVRFEDRAVKPRAVLAIDPIAVHATNLSTAPGSKLGFDVRLGINKSGRLQIAGTSVRQPLAASVKFDLHALEFLPLQPYLQDQVGLTITGGALSLKGQATVKQPAGKSEPQIAGSADIDVSDLATIDRDKQEPLLSWKLFHAGGLQVASAPLVVAIREVVLDDFQSRLTMFPDAHFNLEDALAKPGEARQPRPPPIVKKRTTKAPATAAAASPPPQVSIGQVTLHGGHIVFSDRQIKPSYTAELSDLGGRVSGLSSTAGTTADVDLRATINRSGALTIVGKANPLAKDLMLDVQVAIKDFELPPTSPYSGKFVGYGISKGKLDLALDYKIANRKLDAHNRLVLDQFTFGDKVDSPDAAKLPVRLAVALLKDRHGVIDIELPIAGSLDDPEFKIWGAVIKVLGNLVVKAVTAPFSLIASAFGGGDELSRIDFPAGMANLDATAKKRLGVLARALQERPGISFEIEGGADAQQDREGLRRYLLERKLKGKKLNEMVQAGAAVASPDRVEVAASERPRLLEAAYKTETFAKPKNAVGGEKALPPVEMETLLLANTRVDDDDVRALALRRATAVQAALAMTGPGVASRLFLITPRLGGPGGHVELKLKKD
jgi:Domain of Unknown Function (DUF748)